MTCTRVRTYIDRHFSASGSVEGEGALREHVRGCQPCSTYYERLLLMSKLDPAGHGVEERIARGLGLGRPAARPGWLPVLALGAGSLAIVLLLLRPAGPEGPGDFQARGGIGQPGRPAAPDAGQPADGPGEPELRIYRVAAGRPRAVLCFGERCGTVGASDELAFAYANGPGYAHLSIFGRDEHGHVYWFHPGWSDPAGDPTALSIARGAQTRELPESVAHRYDGRELVVHALFARRALTARAVEALLAAGPAAGTSSLQRLEAAAGGRLVTRRLQLSAAGDR